MSGPAAGPRLALDDPAVHAQAALLLQGWMERMRRRRAATETAEDEGGGDDEAG